MHKSFFDSEVETALEVLRRGGVVLYPTDTVWGLGCDATNEAAVEKIYEIKKRPDTKSLIILVSDERDILQHVAAPDPGIFHFLESQSKPTTVIFDGAIGLPKNVIAADGSIAIRVVKDAFCRHLIKRLRQPLVSTSANVSGEPTPHSFAGISSSILTAADHVVKWRQEEVVPARPSQIIKWMGDGIYQIIRS